MHFTKKKKHYVSNRYSGVYGYKNGYVAKICINGVSNITKIFSKEKEAADAYDKLKIKHLPDSKKINFTEKKSILNNIKMCKKNFKTNKTIVKRRSFSQYFRNKVSSRQSWKCNICRNIFKELIIVDHILPLAKGGSNHLCNLQSLCPECDKLKTGILDNTIIQPMIDNNDDISTHNILKKQNEYYQRNVKGRGELICNNSEENNLQNNKKNVNFNIKMLGVTISLNIT